MEASPRYSVIVMHPDGKREVRASNLTLETAQIAHGSLMIAFPKAQVTIEPPPPAKSR